MEFFKTSFKATLLVSLVLIGGVNTYADDEWIKDGLTEAIQTYSKRSADQPQVIDDTLHQLSKIEGQSEDPELNYDILILESRVYYWKGDHASSRNEKLAAYASGQSKAEKAKQIDDGFAEAYYYTAINLGRWAEADGALTALGKKDQLIALMKDAIRHPTRNNLRGESVDGFGPYRFFGRMKFKMPRWAGGSIPESIADLQKAFTGAQNFAINVVYYAESLNSGTTQQKSLAKKILTELVSQNSFTYNEARLPETIEEFELARQLLKAIN